MKLKRMDISLIFILIAIFKPEGLPVLAKNSIQIIGLLIAMFLFISKNKIMAKDITIVIILPILVSTLISYFKGIISLNNVFNCLFYMTSIFVFSNIVRKFVGKSRKKDLLKILKYEFIVFSLLTLISTFVVGVDESGTTTYLFGGKFTSCYLLAFTIISCLLENQQIKPFKILILCLLLFAFSEYISCTTGMIFSIFMFVLFLLPKKFFDFLRKPAVALTIVVLAGMIPIFIDKLVQNSFVKFIVVEKLGKSLTLSGRLPIYEYYLFPKIKDSLMFGYGYSSSILHTSTPYWNAQNGLLDYTLNYGAVGAILLLILFYLAFKSDNKAVLPIYAFIYGLILISVWECSYSILLYIAFLLIFHLQNKEKTTAKIFLKQG